MPTFTERLRALLPDLYLREDATGDLHTLVADPRDFPSLVP